MIIILVVAVAVVLVPYAHDDGDEVYSDPGDKQTTSFQQFVS